MSSLIHVGCILALAFAIYGISPSSACIEELLECEEIMTKLNENADIPTTCKAFKQTRACLSNLQCPDELKYQVEIISSSLDEMVPICLTDETSPVGQRDDACLKIAHCIGPEFNHALKNKDTDAPRKCRLFQDALNCMNPLIEKCLPSLEPALKIMFTTKRDEMQATVDQQCKAYRVKDAPPKVTRNVQSPACLKIIQCVGNDFNKAVKNKNTDMKTTCRLFQEVIDCMNPLIDECLPTIDDDLSKVFTMQRDQMQKNRDEKCNGVLPSVSGGDGAGSNGIGSSSGTSCQNESVLCHGDLSDLPNLNNEERCKAYGKVFDCLKKINCKTSYRTHIETTINEFKLKKDQCEAGDHEVGSMGVQAASGSGTNAGCDISVCVTKTKLCDMFKCFRDLMKTCGDGEIEKKLPAEIKQRIDGAAKKCGCANLKPSIFFILTAAILMLLRSNL